MSKSKEKDDDRPDEMEPFLSAAHDSSELGPGNQISQFRIERELGRGAAGIVYLAHDTKLDRLVAVKSLPAEVMGNPKARSAFSREARLLASLNHPNIATIYEELEEVEGVGYLVLEYVPGQTLAERIAAGRLELQEALKIALQIAEAVAAAHEHDVIHRDLKPGNTKITPDGKVKVLDFGLAKAIGSKVMDGQSTITEAGWIVGTPAYMSPEQARGEPADKRSDIWSLGCVLYEMLTGKVPFRGETVSETLANILHTEPDWDVLPHATPANIRTLLGRCLTKDPHHRLRDIGDAALEISETLSRHMAGSPAARSAKSRRMVVIAAAAVIMILSSVALWLVITLRAPTSSQAIRLVVLPFENLGSGEDEYFADGITDAITARLAGLKGLGVISRQSAIQYKDREKSIQQIAEELSVDYIMEGTIQRERPSERTSRVRIIPQLIRASDDMHIWAQVYDDDMGEMFRLQSDLAERIAQALDITLLEPERQALKTRPTANMEAYDYYLRGNDYFFRGYLENDLRLAIGMYDKAVELDPTFALAYAQLSRAHAWTYWFHYDHTEERLIMAKQAVDEAFRLSPTLPEVHLALGHYYYHGCLDYNRALEHLAIAREGHPNNSQLSEWIGYIQRRQLKFDQALANLKKAAELDPRSNIVAFEVAQTFMFLRRYLEAEPWYQRAISLAPDFPEPYSWMAWSYLLAEGSIEKAHAVFEQASQNSDSLEDHWIVYRSIVLNVFDRDYQKALSLLSAWRPEAFEPQFYFIPKTQLRAQINGLMGNKQLERDCYESARGLLEAKIQEHPEDARFHSALGIACAGLGQKQDAIREGKLAVELLPVSKDALRGFYRAKDLAQIYAMVGERGAAIDQIKSLLSVPGELSTCLLRLDPVWNPLRNHLRFKELVEEE
jgi:non-specific serine/threonine protein kinase